MRSARATRSSASAPATWPRSRVQDKVFIGDAYTDSDYEARRRDAFIVAVNCSKAGNTCFCVSMDTGPRAKSGYDLALTELLEGEHRFLVEVGLASAGRRSWRRSGRREAEQGDERGRARRCPRSARRRWAASSTPTGSRSCSTATWSTRAGTRSPSAA